MSYLELKDRVELSSIYADTSDMSTTGFYQNNNSLTGSIDKTYLNPPFLTDTSYIYIYGINQQTNKEVSEKWINFSTTDTFTFGTSSEYWNYGYYKIEVRQYDTDITIPNGKWTVLNKIPIYWNKSPLQFMTYIDSGSFEIGHQNISQLGIDNRKLIKLSKPFFIGRTPITFDLFENVLKSNDLDTFNSCSYSGKNSTESNFSCFSFIHSRYYPAGNINFYNGNTLTHTCYANNSDLSVVTESSALSYGMCGIITPTVEFLNKFPSYLQNSYGRVSSGSNTLVAATRSFAEYFMNEYYSTNNNISSLNNQGWIWDIPTFCQWEYACRSGTSTGFNNGVNLINARFTTSSRYEINEISINYKHYNTNCRSCVGKLKPSKWGLYDMHGNVCIHSRTGMYGNGVRIILDLILNIYI